MNLRTSLSTMGYREVKEGVWAKPVGLHLFTYDEKKALWTNWCREVTGNVGVYETHKPGPDEVDTDFWKILANWEAYSRINVGEPGQADFRLPAVDV